MSRIPRRPRGRVLVVDGVARHLLDAPRSSEFDLLESSYDNAGNVVHAEAPFSMWDDGSGAVIDGRRLRHRRANTFADTVDFANRKRASFVLSAANFIQFDGMSKERRASYSRLRKDLERLEGPLIVLGLGVQAPRRWNPRDHALPQEAVDLMRFLGERCGVISARGEFSAGVLRDYAGVRNVIVTGCPSFFQRPEAFAELRENLRGRKLGLTAISVTNLRKPAELEMLSRAAAAAHVWVDVRHPLPADDEVVEDSYGTPIRIDRRGYLEHRTWHHDLRRSFSFGYGTRLHANMAVLLAGLPALWVVHDGRTVDATNALHLPSITLREAVAAEPADLEAAAGFEEMFDHLDGMFGTFNRFLERVGLPGIETPLRSRGASR